MHQSEAVLLNTPLHGNIGDHAIALSESRYLSSIGIRTIDFPWGNDYLDLLGRVTPANKLILITGGGYLGDLWPWEELTVERIIKAFPEHKIIILPQTVVFERERTDSLFAQSKRIYSSHPNLTVFCREQYSIEFMKEQMPSVQIGLAPDMVMILDEVESLPRDGVLVCLRHDKEKTLPDSDEQLLTRILKDYFSGIHVIDTVVGGNIHFHQRERFVKSKLNEFSSSELVITDRLHGMIFAAITETPCIVLNSRSHKIRGCYEWLENLDYIQFAESVNSVPELIERLRKTVPHYKRTEIAAAMAPLRDALIHASGIGGEKT